eukprot:CAMPEP_0178445562 /NCGR_PEP_ID=MMETSP0689_2-20121128/40253_1 /TAXON_ID=160604 /ORGANISM="Amphidinium massartii, Strain CS-259" /LENGTH=1263 /DNA_ID=CAMNT_0020070161 /DNA_START=66 /DNA_END=3857 /DNA_ORIENTATION=+
MDDVVKKLASKSISLETMLVMYDIATRNKSIDSDSTTAELVKGLIKPVGLDSSYVDFLERRAGYRTEPPSNFVIHSWGGKVRDLMTTTAEAANAGGPKPFNSDDLLSVDWHRRNRPENLAARFWVCAFVVNQHTVESAAPGTPKCEIDKFPKVAAEVTKRSGKPILVVLDSENRVFSRTCCLEELYHAIKGGMPLQFCGPKSTDSFSSASTSEAFAPALKEHIDSRIKAIPGGFDAIDVVINRHMTKISGKSEEATGRTVPPRKSTVRIDKKKTTVAAKYAKHAAGDGETESNASTDGEWKHLEVHKRPRTKDPAAKELIKSALRNDRASALLSETEIAQIVEVMEFFEFAAGETVIAQGTVGNTFFAAQSGTLEVSVNNKVCNTVSKGTAFGGRAMLYKCPRTATIKALEDCGVWGVSGDMLHKVLQETAKRHYAENRQFLASVQLFSGLPPKQLDRMGEALFTEVFQDGARVVTEGESATALYFLKQGELAVVQGGVVQANGNLVGGKEVSRLKPGECFGEKALAAGKPWDYTFVAVGRCEVLCISVKELQSSEGNLQGFLGFRLYLALRLNLRRGQVQDGSKLAECICRGIGDILGVAAEVDRQTFSVQLRPDAQTTVVAQGDFVDRSARGVAWMKLTALQSHGLLKRAIVDNLKGLPELAAAVDGTSFQAEVLEIGDRIDATLMPEEGRSELGAILERNFLLLALKRSAFFGQLAADQCMKVLQVMAVKDFKAGEKLSGDLHLVVVVEGELILQESGTESKLLKGQLSESEALGKAETKIAVGPEGARLAILYRSRLNGVLNKDLPLEQASGEETAEFAKKMVLIKKVHIFRHLSQEQTSRLAGAFTVTKMARKECVIRQGDDATSLYVIAQGEVQVLIGEKVIRTMGRNAYFGERALIFDEKRTATIEVTSQEAEFWSLEKATFLQIMNEKMKQALDARIRLQDTSVTLKDVRACKVIGTGAAGIVRLVEHKTTRTRYALKKVAKKKGNIPADLQRECALLKESDHPMIMALVKTFETDKSVYLLTELITGGELYSAIRMIPTALSRTQAQFYTGSLVIVLEELSDRSIVYRDLKPENVMLDSQGYLKLIDFGIAKKLGDDNKTFTTIGTPHYMAPEVMRGRGYGTEVDLWSLGVMLFEFVCGYLPFGDDLEEPTEVCTAVMKAPLNFPAGYRDKRGRSLIQGLLCRQTARRIGCGLRGFDDIREHEFFKLDAAQSSIFDRIMGRELDPPVIPEGETYSDDPAVISASAELSDAGELG